MTCPCGDGYIVWVFRLSGECMYGLTGQLSFSLGCASIGFWIVTQMPQMIENYRAGRADGLSAYFVLQWALGDSCNLVGCLLSGQQAATETYTAVWFVLSDLLLGAQYLYYKWKTRRERRLKRMLRKSFQTNAARTRGPGDRGADEGADGAGGRRRKGAGRVARDSDDSDEEEGARESSRSSSSGSAVSSASSSFTRPLSAAATMMGGSVCVMTTRSFAAPYTAPAAAAAVRRSLQDAERAAASSAASAAGGGGGAAAAAALAAAAAANRNVGRFRLSLRDCSAPQNAAGLLVAGQVLGYASVVFYIGSRIAQIARNYKRKSVEGLSTTMFVFAVLANLTYAAAILLAGADQETIMTRLPWLMGSLGTVALDIIIFVQSFLYADCAPQYVSESESTTPGLANMSRSASTESTALLIHKQPGGRFPVDYHSVGNSLLSNENLSKSPVLFPGESPVTVHDPSLIQSSTDTTATNGSG